MLRANDDLAKAFYSAIAADLGIAGTNILTDTGALEKYTAGMSTSQLSNLTVPFGPANDSYANHKPQTGQPHINSSTIQTNYLCQIPVAKPLPTMIFNVLLADLVFIKAVWTIANFFAELYVESKQSSATWCEGCLHRDVGSNGTQSASNPYLLKQDYKSIPLDEDESIAKLTKHSSETERSR